MAAQLYVGSRRVAWSGVRPWTAAAANLDDALAALADRLAAAPARWPRGAVDLYLSGGLCAAFAFERVQGLRNASELVAIARTAARRATGADGEFSVSLDLLGRDCNWLLGACWSDATLGRCASALHSAGYRLRSAKPWWAAALHTLERAGGLAHLMHVGLQDCDSLTVLSARSDGVFANAQSLAPVVTESEAVSSWRRHCTLIDEADTAAALFRADASCEDSTALQAGGLSFVEIR